MKKRTFGLLLAFVIAMFLAINFSSMPVFASGNINASIRDWNGTVINDATMTVYKSDGTEVGNDTIGSNGWYSIDGTTLVNAGLAHQDYFYVEASKLGLGTARGATIQYDSSTADPGQLGGVFNISRNIELLVRNNWGGYVGISGASVYLINGTNITIAQGTTNASGYVTFIANFSAPENSTDAQFNNVSEIGNITKDAEGSDSERYHFFINISAGYVTYNSTSMKYNRTNASAVDMTNITNLKSNLQIIVEDFSTNNVTATITLFNQSNGYDNLSQPVYNTTGDLVTGTASIFNITLNSSYPTVYYNVSKVGFGGDTNTTTLVSQLQPVSNESVVHIGANILVLVRQGWGGYPGIADAKVTLMNRTNTSIAYGTTNTSGYMEFIARYDNTTTTTDDIFFNITELRAAGDLLEDGYYLVVNKSGYSKYNTSNTSGLYSYYFSNATVINTTDLKPTLQIIIQSFSTDNVTATITLFNQSNGHDNFSQPVYNTSNQIASTTADVLNLTLNSSYPTVYYNVSKAGFGGDLNSTTTCSDYSALPSESVVHIGANILVLVRQGWGGYPGIVDANVTLMNRSANRSVAFGITNASGYVEFVAKYDNITTTPNDLKFNITELRPANALTEDGYYFIINKTGYETHYNRTGDSYYLSNETFTNTTDMNPALQIIVQNFATDNTTATVTVFSDSGLTTPAYNTTGDIATGTASKLNLTLNSSYTTVYYNVSKANYGGDLNSTATFAVYQDIMTESVVHIGPNIVIGVFQAWDTDTAVDDVYIYLYNSSTNGNATIADGTTNETGYIEFIARYDNTSTTATDIYFNGTEMLNASMYHLIINRTTYTVSDILVNSSDMNYTLSSAPMTITILINDSVAPTVGVWLVDSDNATITQVYADNMTIKINASDARTISSKKYRVRNTTSNRVIINWTDLSSETSPLANYTSASIDGIYLPQGNWTLDVNVTDAAGISNVTYLNTTNKTIYSYTSIQITAPTMTGSTSPGGSELTFDFTIIVKGNSSTRNIQGYVDMSVLGTPFLAAADVNNLYINSTTNATTRVAAVVGAYTGAQSLRLSNITAVPSGGLVPASTANLTVMQMGVYTETVRLHIVPYSGVSQGTYDGSYGFRWTE